MTTNLPRRMPSETSDIANACTWIVNEPKPWRDDKQDEDGHNVLDSQRARNLN